MNPGGDRIFIVELSAREALAVAQVVHMSIAQPHNDYAVSALKSLESQCDNISLTPENNWVYRDPLQAPAEAIDFKGLYYVPLAKKFS